MITSTSQYDCGAFLLVPEFGQQVNLVDGRNALDHQLICTSEPAP